MKIIRIKRYILLFSSLFMIFFCCSKSNNEDIAPVKIKELKTYEVIPFEVPTNNVEYICERKDLGVTKGDSTTIVPYYFDMSLTSEKLWNIKHSENTLELNHLSSGCGDECVSWDIYKFKIDENCIGLSYAYYRTQDFFDGIRDIEKIETNISLQVQNWIKNEHFSGQLVISNPLDGTEKIKKFWVDIKPENYSELSETNPLSFDDCLKSKLPLYIDLNNDNVNDFAIHYNVQQYLNKSPQRNKYAINLVSLNENNFILYNRNGFIHSNKENNITTENKDETTNDSFLDVYTDFNLPYQEYSYWLRDIIAWSRPATFPDLENNYFLVKKIVNNKSFYGWINFTIDTNNCSYQIHETFLNSEPDKHIII